MLEFPCSIGTDDKNRVDIASPGHYGESSSHISYLKKLSPTWFSLVPSLVK